LLALLVCRCGDEEARTALDRLQGARGVRGRALQALAASRAILAALPSAGELTDEALWILCQDQPDEGVILAEAMAGETGLRRALARYRKRLAGIELAIKPRDLLAAGVPRGPEIRLRLAATLQARLAGRIRGRRAELAYALSPAALPPSPSSGPPDRHSSGSGSGTV
jgi:hypothetical protein